MSLPLGIMKNIWVYLLLLEGIGWEKTTLCFSKNTDEVTQEAIKEALDVLAIRQYEKYLGLPSFIGRNRTVCFTQIKRKNMGSYARVKGKAIIPSWLGDYD